MTVGADEDNAPANAISAADVAAGVVLEILKEAIINENE